MMANGLDTVWRTILVGAGATLVLDLWMMLLAAVGLAPMNFVMLGRWVGHVSAGRVFHRPIARAAPVAGELAIGWLAHYATGIAFAAVFVGLAGTDWLWRPTFLNALGFGVATVAFPFLVMQPAMGLGIASTNTAAPIAAMAKSLANHAVFGFGLWCVARLFAAGIQ